MNLKCENITPQQNGKNLSNSKEMVDTWNLVVYHDDMLKSPITIRCYMGRSSSASVVYASIWVGTKDISTSGNGSAGGGGYCKLSAAVDSAIRNAGIVLNESIDGRGVKLIEHAMVAIGKYLYGDETPMLVIHN